MKLNYMLIGGFLIVALLVGVVGGMVYYTTNTIKEKKAINDAAKDLLINIKGDRFALTKYLLIEDIDKLGQLNEDIEKYDAVIDMWIEALSHGTDSAEFKEKDAYKTWREGDYEAKGRSISFDPKIAETAEEIEELWEKSEEIYFEIINAHNERLAAKAGFDEEYPKEKDTRHVIMDIIFKSNDPTLLKDIGNMVYKSKEALYQYGDEKHINEWLEDITKLKKDAEADDELIPTELSALSAYCDEYYTIAKTMGNLTLEMKQKEAEELIKLAEFDEYVMKMREGEEEIISLITTETNQTMTRTTFILLAVVFITIILAIALGLYISRKITLPIKKLSETVDEVSKGNFKVEIEKKGNINEINKLADSLDRVMTTMKLAVLEKKEKKK